MRTRHQSLLDRARAPAWPRVRRESAARATGQLLTLMQPRNASGRARHVNAQYGVGVSMCSFTVWALSQQQFPTPQAVQDRFECNRATSYRWLDALAQACGIDTPWSTKGCPQPLPTPWSKAVLGRGLQ